MLDFVYNRNKVAEVMAEDALATMELLEKIKADTKHLGSFPQVTVCLFHHLQLVRRNKALAV